jgi:hypothetical protein
MANMKDRATVKRPKSGKPGTAHDYDTMYTDRPCRLIVETVSSTASGFGRMATGRWALLFQAGTDIRPNDRLVVKSWSKAEKAYTLKGIYDVESALKLAEHTEVVAVERG